ncbi:hypothetical protein YC2023_108026 [Brassica napus]
MILAQSSFQKSNHTSKLHFPIQSVISTIRYLTESPCSLVTHPTIPTDSTLAMLSAPEPVIDHPRISQHTLSSPALDSGSTPHGHHPIQVSVQSWPIHQHSVLYHGRYRTLGLDLSPNPHYHVPTLYIR